LYESIKDSLSNPIDKDCDNLAKELGFDDKDFFDNYILNDSSL
jgi:hypothetical protein